MIYDKHWLATLTGFPGGASGKEPACQCRRLKRHRFNPWVGRIPWRRGHGNPLYYSCLENPMDRETWRATVHRIAQSLDTAEATYHTHTHSNIYESLLLAKCVCVHTHVCVCMLVMSNSLRPH